MDQSSPGPQVTRRTLRTRGHRKYFNVLNKVSKSTVLNVLNYLKVEQYYEKEMKCEGLFTCTVRARVYHSLQLKTWIALT